MPMMLNADLCVNPADVPNLESSALSGSGAAAWKLSAGDSLCGLSFADGEYWAHIAGQDTPEYYKSYASVLNTYQDINDILRADFWYAKDWSAHNAKAATFSDKLQVANTGLEQFNKISARGFGTLGQDPDYAVGTIAQVKAYNATHGLNNPSRLYSVNDTTIWPLRVDALLGSAEAANSLAAYYQADPEYQSFFYWKTIAAEDGDATAELLLAETFGVSVEPNDRLRAIFWAKRVMSDANDPILITRAKQFNDKMIALLNPQHILIYIPPG